MSVSQVVIDRPDLQSGTQRALHSTLTLVAWTAWAYLWLPLVTAIAWYAGLRVFVREMVRPDPVTMAVIVGLYVLIVLSMGGLLVLWARYNRLRFVARERRRHVPEPTEAVSPLEVGLDEDHLALLRRGASLRVVHDLYGVVVGVSGPESSPAPAPQPAPGPAFVGRARRRRRETVSTG